MEVRSTVHSLHSSSGLWPVCIYLHRYYTKCKRHQLIKTWHFGIATYTYSICHWTQKFAVKKIRQPTALTQSDLDPWMPIALISHNEREGEYGQVDIYACVDWAYGVGADSYMWWWKLSLLLAVARAVAELNTVAGRATSTQGAGIIMEGWPNTASFLA